MDDLGGRDYHLDDGGLLVLALLMQIYDHVYDQIKIDTARDAHDDSALTDVATSIAAQWDWDSPLAMPVQYTERGLAALLGCIADPAIARNLYSEVRDKPDPPYPALALRSFATWAGGIAPQKTWPALLWLLSNAYQMLGEVEAAEAVLLRAEPLDPEWGLTLEWLARFAVDRGEVEHGLALLRRAQVSPDHPYLDMLLGMQAPERRDLGRNDKCWCGSGHKYKSCHLRHERLALEQRAYWLHMKAHLALFEDPGFCAQAVETAKNLSQYPDAPQGDDLHPLAVDAVLFEGGGFAQFVDRRGYLLPDDERNLAQRWLSVQRAVYELVFVDPGVSVTLRDVKSGETTRVVADDQGPELKVGGLYCARIVPAGDTMQIFSPMVPVPPKQLDHLKDVLSGQPSPVELIDALKHRRD